MELDGIITESRFNNWHVVIGTTEIRVIQGWTTDPGDFERWEREIRHYADFHSIERIESLWGVASLPQTIMKQRTLLGDETLRKELTPA